MGGIERGVGTGTGVMGGELCVRWDGEGEGVGMRMAGVRGRG